MTTDPKEQIIKDNKNKRPWWKRGLRILSRIALVLLLLLIAIIIFVRSPWGQDIIVGQLTEYVTKKTQTKFSIDKLYITFGGAIDLQGLYLEDQKGDTLLYSYQLKVDIPLWPIIQGNPIAIDGVEWNGLRANVVRKDSTQGFNYDFLMDAFASDSTSTEQEADTTNSDPPKIAIGSINFSDFNVNYQDAVSGMDAHLNLGDFHLEGKNFDLKEMDFRIAEMALKNTVVKYIQSKPSPPSDTTESVLPYLSLEDLKIENVTAFYQSIPDSMEADVKIDELKLEVPKADLSNQNIEVKQLMLNNSDIVFKTAAPQKSASDSLEDSTPENPTTFIWPDWNVEIASISLQNNHLHYQAGKEPKEQKSFNTNYIVLNDFNFLLNDVILSKKESLQLDLNTLSFQENSGLKLKQLSFSTALDSKSFSLNDMVLQTESSELNAQLKADFSSIQNLIDQPEKTNLALQLTSFSLDLKEAYQFQPDLKDNEYLSKLAKHKFKGHLDANGKLSEVHLNEFEINWRQKTSIKTNGIFKNLSDTDNLFADIQQFTFSSGKSDINQIVSEKDLGISIPKKIKLESQLQGRLNDIAAQLQLTVPEGEVKIEGQFQRKEKLIFNAQTKVIDFHLGKILSNPEIGVLAFEIKAEGKGNTIEDLNAELTSDFSKLEYAGYDFSALQLNGNLQNRKGDVQVDYKDDHLNMDIDTEIQLDSAAPKIAMEFQLKGADFYALGLTEKEIRAKLMMQAKFKGNMESFNFETQLREGVAVYEEETYYLGPFDAKASTTKDRTSLDIDSDFLNGKLRANAGIDSLSNALLYHLEDYFSDNIKNKSEENDSVQLQLNMQLSQSEMLTTFLVPELKTMDTLNLDIDFNQKDKKLTTHLNLPYLNYDDKIIDSLHLEFNSTEDIADFKFGFKELDADPFVMHRTYLDGDLKNDLLHFNFHAFDSGKQTYLVKTEVSTDNSTLRIHLEPEQLIFEGENWSIPQDNLLTIHKNKITAKKFVISKNKQSLTIGNDLIKETKNNIGIGFKNFKLESLLALFNKDNSLASGTMQGNIVALNPFDSLGLNVDFNINELTALQTSLGQLSLEAKSKNGNNFNLDFSLKGDHTDLDIKGNYALENVGSELDFKVNLNKIGMKTIADLSGESLGDATGNISGEMIVQGKLNEPEYKGFLQFNDAQFRVNQLNSKFRLAKDKINIENEKITFQQFTIEDEQDNQFTLEGAILTKDFTDPAFDLKIKTKNFQALNSSKEDNEEFYGKVNFDMNGTIKGKTSFPVVDMKIGINESTDFTYVLQNTQAQLEKREGIIEFVNKKNPDDILTSTKDSTLTTRFGGIELHAKLDIDKSANFNVIVDPRTGDNLNISGEGELDFNIARNGRTTLTGIYEINKGHYKLSLYNLVKRKFELEPGSTVSWSGGDPMDADLNVTAKYNIETSASALMASQTAGASEKVQNKYRQRLPFLVFLNVQGELDQPKLDFRLGMPESARGAIDGTVYGKVKQLNNNEDALNKQVFSLLVLNKFYPNAGSDGSGGGTARIVRDNINDALSDQLNSYSDKLMGNSGVELNFGLNSYTDYQGESAEQRTDLDVSAQKKLLDDRLIVQVGSTVNVQGDSQPGEENQVVGNASIQYLLTKDGRWRLKGFRNSEYENVIDGQVYVNGISLIFQRQFNKFKEVFGTSPKKEDSPEVQDEEKKKVKK